MGVIYQLTFFVALGLLAIVVTIFVFAVSLLGRAIEAASITEKEKLTERKENNIRAMEIIQEDIEKARKSGEIPTELTHKLEKLEKENKKFEMEMSKIRKAPEALTVRGGVFCTGVFLIAALVLSGMAWYFSLDENVNIIIPQAFWILGLAAIGYGIYRICKSLKVIQDVAVTSEEAWVRKTIEAFKIAEREIDEEKRPQVQLTFRNVKFPLEMPIDSEVTIESIVKVIKGDFVENVEVHIIVPPGFGLLNEKKTHRLSLGSTYPNYVFTTWEPGSMVQGILYARKTTIKSPSTVGNFKIIYAIVGRGLAVQRNYLEFIVK